MTELCEQLRRVVTNGGSVIILKQFYMFAAWNDSIYSVGYDVMSNPLFLGHKSTSVPNSNNSKFTRNGCDFAMVARLPPSSSSNSLKTLKSDFSVYFQSIDANISLHLSAMFNVPLPNSKLCEQNSRVPFHVS